jgi:hypothetical protein
MADLIVVVDPNFGDRLESRSQLTPIWIVASPDNKDACHRLWVSHSHADHREKGAATHYSVSDLEARMENLLEIIPQLETHHGEVAGDELIFPDGFLLEVVGLSLTDNVANRLREFGFSSFEKTSDGFQARRDFPALTGVFLV